MNATDYKPTKVKAKRRKDRGLLIPKVTSANPNRGVERILSLSEVRYQVWYLNNLKRHTVLLPKGLTIEEARTRRDTLYKNLKETYGAKASLSAGRMTQQINKVTLTPSTYIYYRKPWVVRIRGKQIGDAKTQEGAEAIRNAWLAVNPNAIPNLVTE